MSDRLEEIKTRWKEQGCPDRDKGWLIPALETARAEIARLETALEEEAEEKTRQRIRAEAAEEWVTRHIDWIKERAFISTDRDRWEARAERERRHRKWVLERAHECHRGIVMMVRDVARVAALEDKG